MTFSLSLDRLALTITIATTLLFGWLLAFQIIPQLTTDLPKAVALGLILIGTYCVALLYRPRNYTVSNKCISIRRLGADFTIQLNTIRQVRLFTKEEMKFTVRTFGVGGLFGYFGFFSNFKAGKLRLFASRRNNTVLLTLDNNEKIILTPDDPQGMIEYLQRQGVPAADSTSIQA